MNSPNDQFTTIINSDCMLNFVTIILGVEPISFHFMFQKEIHEVFGSSDAISLV